MDSTLAELLDRTRIVETIDQLFIGTDRRDWDAVTQCFAPSVVFDMSSVGAGPAKTLAPAEIVAAWDAGLKPLEAIHHQAGNYVVHVRGHEADAFCYGIASHYLPNKTGANTRTFVGSYDFALARSAGRWVITKFKFNLKYVDGNPSLESS